MKQEKPQIIDLPRSRWYEIDRTEVIERLRRKNKVVFISVAVLIVLGLLMQPVIEPWLSLIPLPITLFKTENPPSVEALANLSLAPHWNYQTRQLTKLIGATENEVIFYTNKSQLAALDIATGELLWQYDLMGSVRTYPEQPVLINNLLIFVDELDTRTKLIVLDTTTGQEVWNWESEYQIWAYAADKNNVYVSIRPYHLALNLQTGEINWKSTLRGTTGSLLISNDELIVVAPEMSVLDVYTGEVKRGLEFLINGGCAKIYDGVIYWAFGKVTALNTKSNSIEWETDKLNLSGGCWEPLLKDDRVFVGISGELGALDKSTGDVVLGKGEFDENEMLWGKPDDEPVLQSNPVFVDDVIYVYFSDGSLRMFDASGEQEIGRVEFGAAFDDARLVASDEILVVSPGGQNLYAFSFVD